MADSNKRLAVSTSRTIAFARKLWATDDEMPIDREIYATFDDMPLGLQQWWCDRAVRKIAELRLLDETGYPT